MLLPSHAASLCLPPVLSCVKMHSQYARVCAGASVCVRECVRACVYFVCTLRNNLYGEEFALDKYLNFIIT